MLFTPIRNVLRCEQIKRQCVNPVLKLVDFIHGCRSVLGDGVELRHRVTNIPCQSLTHGFRQRIDRAAQQHRQRNQTPDQGLATRTLLAEVQIQLHCACAVAIDQYFILKRFTIWRHLASHSELVAFDIQRTRGREKALIGIELQLSHQAQPVAGSEFNRGPRGELLCGGAGMLAQSGVLNGQR